MHPILFAKLHHSDQFIQKWLKARQNMIVAFNQLCELRPFTEHNGQQITLAMQDFCQFLVDYTSFGHFRVFEGMTDVIERAKLPMAKQLPTLLGSINQTTHCIVVFNDRHADLGDISKLESELSFLAEQLAKRFEWEDALIRLYSRSKMEQRLAKTA